MSAGLGTQGSHGNEKTVTAGPSAHISPPGPITVRPNAGGAEGHSRGTGQREGDRHAHARTVCPTRTLSVGSQLIRADEADIGAPQKEVRDRKAQPDSR